MTPRSHDGDHKHPCASPPPTASFGVLGVRLALCAPGFVRTSKSSSFTVIKYTKHKPSLWFVRGYPSGTEDIPGAAGHHHRVDPERSKSTSSPSTGSPHPSPWPPPPGLLSCPRHLKSWNHAAYGLSHLASVIWRNVFEVYPSCSVDQYFIYFYG